MTTVPAKRTATGAPVVALVCVGIFMTTLDASIVNIGLPSIARAFGTPLTGTLEWIVIGYLVVIGALLLTFGRLSDMIGRSPIWIAGLIIFTAGSAVCGAAPSLGLLIAARALQGVGGALILSTSTAILSNAVPATQRGHALGWGALAIALGASAGPTIGGFLTTLGTWRWIFYVNVPIGLVAILATLWLIPPTLQRSTQKFDLQGALLLAIALAALTLGLSFGQEWGWTSALVLGTSMIGVARYCAFALIEARSKKRKRRIRSSIWDCFAIASSPRLLRVSLLLDAGAVRDRLSVSFLLRGAAGIFAGAHGPPAHSLSARDGDRGARSGSALGSGRLARTRAARAGDHYRRPPFIDAARRDEPDVGDMVAARSRRRRSRSLPVTKHTLAHDCRSPNAAGDGIGGFRATAGITGQALSVAVAGAVFATLGGAAAGSALAVAPAADAGRPALEATFLHAFHVAIATCAAFAALGAVAALVRGREGRPRVKESPAPVLSRNVRAVPLVMCVALGVARGAVRRAVP